MKSWIIWISRLSCAVRQIEGHRTFNAQWLDNRRIGADTRCLTARVGKCAGPKRYFEALVQQVTGASFTQISRDMIDTPDARATFEAGKTAEGDYAFDQPLLVTLLRAPKPR